MSQRKGAVQVNRAHRGEVTFGLAVRGTQRGREGELGGRGERTRLSAVIVEK